MVVYGAKFPIVELIWGELVKKTVIKEYSRSSRGVLVYQAPAAFCEGTEKRRTENIESSGAFIENPLFLARYLFAVRYLLQLGGLRCFGWVVQWRTIAYFRTARP